MRLRLQKKNPTNEGLGDSAMVAEKDHEIQMAPVLNYIKLQNTLIPTT